MGYGLDLEKYIDGKRVETIDMDRVFETSWIKFHGDTFYMPDNINLVEIIETTKDKINTEIQNIIISKNIHINTVPTMCDIMILSEIYNEAINIVFKCHDELIRLYKKIFKIPVNELHMWKASIA